MTPRIPDLRQILESHLCLFRPPPYPPSLDILYLVPSNLQPLRIIYSFFIFRIVLVFFELILKPIRLDTTQFFLPLAPVRAYSKEFSFLF